MSSRLRAEWRLRRDLEYLEKLGLLRKTYGGRCRRVDKRCEGRFFLLFGCCCAKRCQQFAVDGRLLLRSWEFRAPDKMSLYSSGSFLRVGCGMVHRLQLAGISLFCRCTVHLYTLCRRGVTDRKPLSPAMASTCGFRGQFLRQSQKEYPTEWRVLDSNQLGAAVRGRA